MEPSEGRGRGEGVQRLRGAPAELGGSVGKD